MATLNEIDIKAKLYADARARLSAHVTDLRDQLEQAKRAALPYIKSQVAAVKEREAALRALIEESPELFVKPRSVVVHGIKVGFEKSRGRITVADLDKTLKLIRQHFAEKFDTLVKTTRKLVKKAVGNLPAADLKKIAVEIEGTGDVVVIEDTTSDIDKLVSALLDEGKGEEDES